MFIIIPLILSLSAHAVVPHNVDIFFLSSEMGCTPKIDWVSENQRIERDLPNMNEIVQLAKNAATQLNSPPRIYATSGNSTSLWPNQPGSVETTYGTRGMQLPGQDIFSGTVPMTLTTLVEANTSPVSYNVIFQSKWISSNETMIHVWKFHVSADRQVTFIGEEGDELPPLPM